MNGLFDFGFSPGMTGPLQFFLAENDFLVCDGDCKGVQDPAVPAMLYPNAVAIDTYIQPGAGHGMPLHRNASAGFAVQLAFLDRYGV